MMGATRGMKAGKDEALGGSGGMLSLNGRHFVTEGPNGPNTAQMAGSTAVVEVALRNRFKDGEGAKLRTGTVRLQG